MDSVLVGPCEEKGCFALQGLQIIQFKLGSRCLELMRFLLHPPPVHISFTAACFWGCPLLVYANFVQYVFSRKKSA